MAGVNRRGAVAASALLAGTLALSACGGGGGTTASTTAHTGKFTPERIMNAPKNLLSAAEPQSNGTMWVLAGTTRSRGLYQIDPSNGQMLGSISVSNAADSVAQTSTGLIGLGLDSNHAGALELLDSHTAKVRRTIPLPAPVHDLVVGSDGSTFYALTSWPSAASVTILNSANGRIQGTVPMPKGTVSIVPDVQQSTIYALQSDGLVSQVGVAGGKIRANFKIGDSGTSLAVSPDGNTLYALKDTDMAANVAVVDVATESVRRVLPAPADCQQVLVDPSGDQLYDVVGSPRYGNVQIYAL